MTPVLILAGFFLFWILLQAVILPRLGVSTWISRACGPEDRDGEKPVDPAPGE